MTISEETRAKQRAVHKQLWKDPEYRAHMVEAHNGKKVGEETRQKLSDSRRGIPKSSEHKKKIGVSQIGEKNHMFGKHHTGETRKRISEGLKGTERGKETRSKMAICRIANNNPNWQGGVSFEPYCEKFNDACKERIRDGFGRKCLNCDQPEAQNLAKSGKARKLSVHHIRYNKQEGCDGNDFFLAPLCLKCHNKTTTGDRDHWMQDLSEKRSRYLASH